MTYETNYYWHIFILTSSELTLGSCTGVEALAVCLSAKAPMGLAFDWPRSTRMPGHPPLQSAQGLPDGAGNPWRQGLFDDASGRKQSVRVSLLQSKSPLAKGGWPRRQRRDCNINSFLCSLSSPCFFPNMLAGALCSLTLRWGKHWTRPGCFLDKRKNSTFPGKKVCATSGIFWKLRSYHRSKRAAERTNFSPVWPFLMPEMLNPPIWVYHHSTFPSWQCCLASKWLWPNCNVTCDRLLRGRRRDTCTRFIYHEVNALEDANQYNWDNPRPSNCGMLGLSDLVQLMMRELLWAHPVKVTVEDEG